MQEPKGIIAGQAPQEQAPPTQPNPREPGVEQGGSNSAMDVDPQALEAFLQASGDVISNNKDQIAQAVQENGVEQVASQVFNQVDDSFESVSDITKFFGGLGMLQQMSEALQTMGAKEVTPEEKMKIIATMLAEGVEKGIKSGKYNPNEILEAAKTASGKIQQQQAQQGIVSRGTSPPQEGRPV